jgi:hypothetical protein
MKGEAVRIGKQLLDKTKQMFNWWEKIRDGTLSRGEFRKRMQPICVARLNHFPAPSPAAFIRLGLLNAYPDR